MARKLRIYLDTSVIGGCLDDEFRVHSRRLFDEIRLKRFIAVISDVTISELEDAPDAVRSVLADLPEDCVELRARNEESDELMEAYLSSRVVGAASKNDAAHIAVATVAGVDMVVSWNFRHIVHFDKIAGYEGVNTLRGYRSPRIYSPREVVTE